MTSKCAALRADGGRCRGIPATNSDYCPAHDPLRAQERREAASKAARARHAGGEVGELKSRLRELYRALESDEIDVRTGATMVQAARALLATIQAEAELQNAAELEKRLERVEALDRATRRAGG